MKIISGKVIAAERVLLSFNNEKAYHAKGRKVYTKFLLDDGKTYWSDNHIDEFKVGRYVEFYGGKGYDILYINQDTAKALIKEKRISVIEHILPLVMIVLGVMAIYACDKIWGKPVPTEIYFSLFNIFAYMSYMTRLSYKVSNEPKGKDVKKLKAYAKGYAQQEEVSFLNTEEITQAPSFIKEKSIYYKE